MNVNTCNEIIKLLLKKKIEIDAQDEYGWTALMIASLKGYPETVKLLLEHKAHVDTQNIDGFSSLMFACLNGKNETAQVLLEHRANVNEQSKDGVSALMIASRKGHTETVKLLLNHRARVNDQDKDGWCALMFASRNGHVKTVKHLLELRSRYTMMIQDVIHEKFSLEDHRVDINQQNKDGCTSLMIAVASETITRSRQIKIVKYLLKHGADVTIKDKSGCSAMDYTAKHGDVELADLLMQNIEYDHLPSIEMTQHPTQYNDLEYSTIIQRPPNVTAPSNDRNTFQPLIRSEYDHLPCISTSLTSTNEQGSTLKATNVTASSCVQTSSWRHSEEAETSSFQQLEQCDSGYDHLTVTLTPRSDNALDFENCVISKGHIDMISGLINEREGEIAKQLGYDITTIKNEYYNAEPKLIM